MLYSFSQANYTDTELTRYFEYMTENDAVLLWQNGVLLAIKYAPLLQQCKALIYALDLDIQARGLSEFIPQHWLITMQELSSLTERVTPQLAL